MTGGASRAESVRLGVNEVPPDAVALLVHDAARPLLAEDVISRVLEPLGEGWDGAVPALPVADTIKRVEGEQVAETLARDGLVAAQTPQAFVADVLRAALVGDVDGASDCASLVEAAGGRVKVVDGDPRLLKVTTAQDLRVVEALLAETIAVIVDYHMHLRDEAGEIDFAPQAVGPFVETAIARGVAEIGFTEHVYYFRQTAEIWDVAVPVGAVCPRPRRVLRRRPRGEARGPAGEARARGGLRRRAAASARRAARAVSVRLPSGIGALARPVAPSTCRPESGR